VSSFKKGEKRKGKLIISEEYLSQEGFYMIKVTYCFEVEKCTTVFQTSRCIFSQNPHKIHKINMKGQCSTSGIKIFTFMKLVLGVCSAVDTKIFYNISSNNFLSEGLQVLQLHSGNNCSLN